MTNDTIIFNLKKEWFDKIKSGEKNVEYRQICDHWMRRLTDGRIVNGTFCGNIRRFKYAEIRLGYRKDGAIRREITNIDLGPCPYDGWNDKEYFRIYFK